MKTNPFNDISPVPPKEFTQSDVKRVWFSPFIKKAKGFLRRGQSLTPMLFLMKQGRVGIVSLGNIMDHK